MLESKISMYVCIMGKKLHLLLCRCPTEWNYRKKKKEFTCMFEAAYVEGKEPSSIPLLMKMDCTPIRLVFIL